MAEPMTTAKYLNRFEASDKQHMKRVRKIRQEVLADESLSDLDRAVLGATGSAEELSRYQQLATKIGRLAGQPIIRIHRMERDQVTEASGGIIVGSAEATSDYYAPRGGEKRFVRSTLSVPISPSVSWWVSRSMHPVHEEEKVFFDQDNSMYDRGQGISNLEVANISAVYPNREHTQVVDPYSEFEHRIPHNTILVGREAIYNHVLFSAGINKVLTALDERAAHVQLEPQAAS